MDEGGIATLLENVAARDFHALLPLTLAHKGLRRRREDRVSADKVDTGLEAVPPGRPVKVRIETVEQR